MTRIRSVVVGAVALAVIGMTAACTPPAPVTKNATFKATKVTVNSSQDAVRDPLFGACISLTGCSDEPYVEQVWFRVKIGVANSAQAGVVKGSATSSLGDGSSKVLSGGEQATVNFSGVNALDVASALTGGNSVEVMGVYTWAAEEDAIDSLTTGANGVALSLIHI